MERLEQDYKKKHCFKKFLLKFRHIPKEIKKQLNSRLFSINNLKHAELLLGESPDSKSSAETKSAETKSADAKSAETKSAETKSAETKSAETKSAETKSAETKSAETKSAETKSAETKSAETKSSPIPLGPEDQKIIAKKIERLKQIEEEDDRISSKKFSSIVLQPEESNLLNFIFTCKRKAFNPISYPLAVEIVIERITSDKKANEADEKANEADEKANETDEKANETDEKATETDEKATEANEKANEANEKATEANEKATEANEKANEADEKANKAKDTSNVGNIEKISRTTTVTVAPQNGVMASVAAISALSGSILKTELTPSNSKYHWPVFDPCFNIEYINVAATTILAIAIYIGWNYFGISQKYSREIDSENSWRTAAVIGFLSVFLGEQLLNLLFLDLANSNS